MQRKQNWVHEIQHVVFRIVSVIFSAGSAYSIYWFFSVLNGNDSVQLMFTLSICIGFVVLGYFVTRGLAHRLMNKQRVYAYLFIGFLYLFVEVVCNYGHALAHYQDVRWIQQLQGSPREFFSSLMPVVLSILPLFNVALAWIDMDLMREKQGGAFGSVSAPAVPKGAKAGPMPASGAPTTHLGPQAAYPSNPAPAAGGNTLHNYWQKVGAGQASAPQAAAAMNGRKHP